MKSPVLRALDAQIKEMNAQLDNLLEARELLAGPKKERKPRKPRETKEPDLPTMHLHDKPKKKVEEKKKDEAKQPPF